MALIKCPECGNQISDKAITCPHCGYPITATHVVEKASTRRSFTVAYRSGPGFILPLCIILFCFALFFDISAIIILIFALNLFPVSVFLFAISIPIHIACIIDFVYFSMNNKLMNKNCIEYNAEKDKLILCALNGEIIEINAEDYITLKDNFFTDNMLHFTYKTSRGVARKVKLGYCSNREQIRSNIAKVTKQKL